MAIIADNLRLCLITALAAVAVPLNGTAQIPSSPHKVGSADPARTADVATETKPASNALKPVRPLGSLADCRALINSTRVTEDENVVTIQRVAACLKHLRDDVAVVAALQPGEDRRARLVELRVDFKRLTGWLPDRESETSASWNDEWLTAAELKATTRRELYSELRRNGLFAKFSAVLVSGVALADTNGADDASSAPAATAAPAASAVPAAKGADTAAAGIGNILWQSRHAGDQTVRKLDVDVSIGGRIGMQPVLNLVSSKPDAGATSTGAPALTAVHQNAFVWTAGVQAHMPLESLDSEVGIYGGFGSALLTTVPKVLGFGSSAQLALPLDAGTKRNAWRWEAGVSFDVFDNSLDQIHAEGGTLSPQFQVLLGWRRDDRFADAATFGRAADRLVFRLALDAIRVFDKRQIGDEAPTYTFGFVVEHERDLGRRGLVPSATRYLLRGDVNLLNAVGAAASAAAKTESPFTAWTAALPGPRQLALAPSVSRVAVALKALESSDKQSVKATPSPTVEVTPDQPGEFAIPTCAGAKIRLMLDKGTVELTTIDWGPCSISSVDLAVTPK